MASVRESHYRGVQKHPWGRYAAEIHKPWKKTRVWLGTFDTLEEAALAYNGFARNLRGAKAKTNFPAQPSSALSLDLNLPSNHSFFSPSGWLMITEFLHTAVLEDAANPQANDIQTAVAVVPPPPDDETSARYFGILRCGLPIDLNEPPPLWI